MAKIKDDGQYQVLLKRVETLMETVQEDTPSSNPDFIELDLLADLVEEYEMEHYPVGQPDLSDILKLRMYEMQLTQKSLAELLGVSAPRISEYLRGKAKPTFPIARIMHHKLQIDGNLILA
ncbi:MAG: helix-turn-helix domain-containing protein [Dysgonamonadaceae bacterium]|jgi:HTH-type transcriptional regulator/antitoxin HigA|nr:helix-turn-helix domain-containing protein [Dysgonamonadaceae bacterium]